MSSFTIMQETFGKEGSNESVEGLTVIVDGILKEMFDKIIRESDEYSSYTDVLSSAILKGIDSIIVKEKK